MKYRIDFVTNSSSSSSVVVSIVMENGTEKKVQYFVEWYACGLNRNNDSYKLIMKALCSSIQIQLINEYIENTKIELAWIDGANNVYLDNERISEYISQYPDDNVTKVLKLLLKLDYFIHKTKLENYEDFINSDFWQLIGIENPNEIIEIKEKMKVSTDGGPFIEKTAVDVKTLKRN